MEVMNDYVAWYPMPSLSGWNGRSDRSARRTEGFRDELSQEIKKSSKAPATPSSKIPAVRTPDASPEHAS